VGRPEVKSHLEDPGIDGRIILRWIFRKGDVRAWTGWIFRKGDVRAWTGLIWLRIGTGGGHL